jgi:hypothetical protein
MVYRTSLEDLVSTRQEPGSGRGRPGLLWPRDRAWFIATDVDQDSTFVGGSLALVGALVASPAIEALPVEPTDSIAAGADVVNL